MISKAQLGGKSTKKEEDAIIAEFLSMYILETSKIHTIKKELGSIRKLKRLQKTEDFEIGLKEPDLSEAANKIPNLSDCTLVDVFYTKFDMNPDSDENLLSRCVTEHIKLVHPTEGGSAKIAKSFDGRVASRVLARAAKTLFLLNSTILNLNKKQPAETSNNRPPNYKEILPKYIEKEKMTEGVETNMEAETISPHDSSNEYSGLISAIYDKLRAGRIIYVSESKDETVHLTILSQAYAKCYVAKLSDPDECFKSDDVTVVANIVIGSPMQEVEGVQNILIKRRDKFAKQMLNAAFGHIWSNIPLEVKKTPPLNFDLALLKRKRAKERI
jgi:hypothetical protein